MADTTVAFSRASQGGIPGSEASYRRLQTPAARCGR